MNRSLRITLTAADALAVIIALGGYISSFFNQTVERFGGAIFVLFGLFFLNCVLLLYFRPAEALKFSWRFSKLLPWWARWTSTLLAIMVIGHFAAFWIRSGWGVPQVRDGVYVIAARGQVLKEITESEYVLLEAAELRLICIFWIAGFIHLVFDWWFERAGSKRM